MKENERGFGTLSACTVSIPELGKERTFDGIYSINDRLNVWIDCRSGKYDEYCDLYNLCASNDFFTVNISSSLGNHTGFNCICISPVIPFNYIEPNTLLTRNEPISQEGLLEVYCNYWLEGQIVASMNNERKWNIIGVTFPDSYYWFRHLSPGKTKSFETDIGRLEFGINENYSSNIFGKATNERFGYAKIDLPIDCSCDEAIDYTMMFQILVRFVSGVPFSIEDIVLAKDEIRNPRIILHGNYGIREIKLVTDRDYYSMLHDLSALSEEGLCEWIRYWQEENPMALISFEKNRCAKVYSRIVDGIKCFDGISSSLSDNNTLYDKESFKCWKKSLIKYIANDNNPLNIPLDRITSLLDNLQNRSLKNRMEEFLIKNEKEFSKVNCGNRSKVINYLCGLRNIDSHKKTSKRELNNNTGLTIFELESVVTKMVHLIVYKEILFL